MLIKSIRLRNYRSYSDMEFEPSTGLNVIVGANAAGKTNILESIFLSALGRSHRTSRDAELINNSSHSGYVGIEFVSDVGARTVEMKLREGEHKQVLIDGRKVARIGELMGVLNVVMFSPEDLSIVKNSPQERRRFMDMELCQLRPTYFYRLQQYNAALKQRSALVKEGYLVSPDPSMLDAWDERLSVLGGEIMSIRQDFMDDISTIANDLHRRITEDGEQLFVFYKPNVPFEAVDPKRTLYEALTMAKDDDLRRGYTTRGPHRDDIGIRLGETDVRVYGSQGQQRTAALSIKLSEIALMKRDKGESPVLLLDDVLSELDGDRQRALLSGTFDCQCFLTTTTLDGLENLPNMTVFECADGKLKRIK